MSDSSPAGPHLRDLVGPGRPGAVISMPCEACAGDADDCPRCEGTGIELWRVAPADAASTTEELRTRLDPPHE